MNSVQITQDYENRIQAIEAEFAKQILSYQNQLATYQAELNTYQKRCEQYAQAYDTLQEQVKALLRNRFGKKTERFIDPENPQYTLLDDNNKFLVADAQDNEEGTPVAAHSRKKKK